MQPASSNHSGCSDYAGAARGSERSLSAGARLTSGTFGRTITGLSLRISRPFFMQPIDRDSCHRSLIGTRG